MKKPDPRSGRNNAAIAPLRTLAKEMAIVPQGEIFEIKVDGIPPWRGAQAYYARLRDTELEIVLMVPEKYVDRAEELLDRFRQDVRFLRQWRQLDYGVTVEILD